MSPDTKPEISLVAPCLNEEENVGELCRRFLAAAQRERIDSEVILVDDGSTDRTWQVMMHLEAEHKPLIKVIQHSTNRGIPQSWITGVENAQGRIVCLIDSDLQNPPEAVFTLYAAYITNDTQLVRGVRLPAARPPLSRLLFSRALNALLNLTFGMKSRDNKSGFLLADRATMLDLVRHKGHYQHYQTFIGVSAHAQSLRTIEVLTPFNDRRAGVSFLTGRTRRIIFQVAQDIPKACREFGWRYRRTGTSKCIKN
jgi:phenylacetate-CoA ligase